MSKLPKGIQWHTAFDFKSFCFFCAPCYVIAIYKDFKIKINHYLNAKEIRAITYAA